MATARGTLLSLVFVLPAIAAEIEPPRGTAYEQFFRTSDPHVLASLTVTVPLDTISSDLASLSAAAVVEAPATIASSSADRVFFREPIWFDDGLGAHLFFTRMSIVAARDYLGNRESWHHVLFHSIRTDDGWSEPAPVLEGDFGIGRPLLLRDPNGALVMVLRVFNSSSAEQFGAKPGESNVLYSRFDGRWSRFEPLLPSTSRPGASDAAFDRRGRLHVVYAPREKNASIAQVHHLVVDRSEKRSEVPLRLPLRDVTNVSILEVEPALAILVAADDVASDDTSLMLLRPNARPRLLTDHVFYELTVHRSDGQTMFATMTFEARPRLLWWVLRHGVLSDRKEIAFPAGTDRRIHIVRGGSEPLFAITREGAAYLVRARGDAAEAAAITYSRSQTKRIFSTARTANEDRIETLISHDTSVERGVLDLTKLRWRPIENEIWQSTRGRGLGPSDRERIRQLLREMARRARDDERVRILRAIARDFGNDQESRKELDRLCTGSSLPLCIEYVDQRDAAECSYGWSEKCRARQERLMAQRCASGDDRSGECIRWRYETGRAIDPFLEAAFREEEKSAKAIDPKRRSWAESQLAAFRRDALLERAARLDPWFAQDGFPLAAELIRDRDPRVRAAAARVLAFLDLRRTAPFLAGLLTDCGAWISRIPTDFNPGVPITVCGTAGDTLGMFPYFDQKEGMRVPLDDPGPLAKERARQRYVMTHYLAHLPQRFRGGAEFMYVRAIALELGIDFAAAKQLALGEGIDSLIRFELEASTDSMRYRRGQPVVVTLVLRNLGRRAIKVRGRLDPQVHQLKLVGPDGAVLAMRDAPRPLHAAIFTLTGDVLRSAEYEQGVIGVGVASWELKLHELFDLSVPGRYRLEYEYVPPAVREEPELSTPGRFRFWNGREIADQFELVVE